MITPFLDFTETRGPLSGHLYSSSVHTVRMLGQLSPVNSITGL